ncbi:MAG: UDP-2,3-diacylglucosamine diphosphatase LpxI [Opitutales bacterium]
MSKYTPENFEKASALILIAGRGEYPKILRDNALKEGVDLKLIAFKDETEDDLYESFAPTDRVKIGVGQISTLLKSAKNFGAKFAIMAGQIRPKKLFNVIPDLKAIKILATLKEKNAESIFGAIAKELAEIDIELIDARSFMDSDIASEGFIAGKDWEVSQEALAHGLKIVRECASLDIGQACVVSNGTTLAVEGFDGTDNMIERCKQFKAKQKLFLKTVKRKQDYRFDVPVIGSITLDKLAENGIKNVAIESDKVLMLNKDNLIKHAKKLGIKIFGL